MVSTDTEGADISLTDKKPVATDGSHWSGTARRQLDGRTKLIAVSLAVIIGAYHVYTAGTGVPGAFINRPVHLVFMASLVFIWYSPKLQTERTTVPWYDWLLVGLTAVSVFYLTYHMQYGELAGRAGSPLLQDIIVGIVGTLLVLEMARRMTGLILPIIAVGFMAYAYLGPYMPGLFAHRGYSLTRIISHLYLSTEGIFGLPLGVSATFVIVFIIFGAFLETTGIGDWFIDVAYGITGRLSGGPAKTSVLASGFMGSLSGSAVANTATTGAFTIPLMKRTGFDSEYAGAVESAASTGGQVLPPVMAAAAFIMAAWTGISYATIIAAAAIPALLYFLSVGFAVHFRAKKQGLKGLPASELPDARRLFISKIHYTIPLIALVYFLAEGFSAMLAGFYAIMFTLAVALSRRNLVDFGRAVTSGNVSETRTLTTRGISTVTRALDRGVQMTLVVAAACATAGIVVGVVTLTGLGLRFASLVSALAGDVILIALVLTMITSIILGMGLPTTAAYIVLAALGAPALTQMGVDLLAAHLFILYFGVMSSITPPIMLAVFAAAGIAESDPWRTGFQSVKIALVGFIIPYLFVYGNELLLVGSTTAIVLTTLTAAIGVIALASGLQSYLLTDLSRGERVLLCVGALVLLMPGVLTDVAGIVLLSGVVGYQYLSLSREQTAIPISP